jgi:hypothetical protein
VLRLGVMDDLASAAPGLAVWLIFCSAPVEVPPKKSCTARSVPSPVPEPDGDRVDKEMQRAMMSARGESRSFVATAQRLNDAKAAAEKMKAQADQAEADRAAAEKDLVAAKEETSGNAIKLNQDVEKLREKLTDAKMQIEVGESRQQQLDAALRELEQAQGE